MIQVQAKDLRIGNNIYWLHEESEEVLTVDAEMIVSIDDFNKFEYEKDEYSRGMFWSAIPLTPEILERCGFKKEFDVYSNELIELANVTDGNGKKSFVLLKNDEAASSDFHSLHQLQNLYFSLTGKELEYKP